jgi:hypothetical protein
VGRSIRGGGVSANGCAARWDERMGRFGDCHEVAKQNSPGLQPWVWPPMEMRPEGAPERDSESSHGPASTQDLKVIDRDLARHGVRTTFRSPFQGDFLIRV